MDAYALETFVSVLTSNVANVFPTGLTARTAFTAHKICLRGHRHPFHEMVKPYQTKPFPEMVKPYQAKPFPKW